MLKKVKNLKRSRDPKDLESSENLEFPDRCSELPNYPDRGLEIPNRGLEFRTPNIPNLLDVSKTLDKKLKIVKFKAL